ncbi:cephalosporin hydroxylase [Anabaena sp. FACHB-1237]|uniref:CmcI family methyltransferase n=1 Tax=Anabaena sp. FACHB-1237 TaxID=2692769 RepID=UPI001680E0CC|nr:CmcI family methyltransferase [Anabaena sp. FACHB-1237]MBD2139721.1 cephalosporin hydroxylase [Anabaena sp. FACHB-1237]
MNNQRFMKISEREDKCDLPKSTWRPLTENAYLQTWKGVLLEKDPMQIASYPMLIDELKPKTIIELGALKGGSAIWLADNLELLGIEGQVYCIDNDLSQLDEKAKADSRIHFLEGDCREISTVLPTELLDNLPHPWLVIEDVHDNIVGILEHFHHNGLETGDYIIIEDTNKFMWEVWDDWEDQELIKRGYQKMNNLRQWLMSHQEEYMIDSYYQDMYGYNASKNWNSILKKVFTF